MRATFALIARRSRLGIWSQILRKVADQMADLKFSVYTTCGSIRTSLMSAWSASPRARISPRKAPLPNGTRPSTVGLPQSPCNNRSRAISYRWDRCLTVHMCVTHAHIQPYLCISYIFYALGWIAYLHMYVTLCACSIYMFTETSSRTLENQSQSMGNPCEALWGLVRPCETLWDLAGPCETL